MLWRDDVLERPPKDSLLVLSMSAVLHEDRCSEAPSDPVSCFCYLLLSASMADVPVLDNLHVAPFTEGASVAWRSTPLLKVGGTKQDNAALTLRRPQYGAQQADTQLRRNEIPPESDDLQSPASQEAGTGPVPSPQRSWWSSVWPFSWVFPDESGQKRPGYR